MLIALRIKNLALASDLTVEFQPGYNAISGETGAGKSMLIGALNLVLGERADRTLIRSGADSCAVEAVFDVSTVYSEVSSMIEENGLEPCEGQSLILKRSFTSTGTNRQFVNGSATTLAVLGQIGTLLVDMHGPHDHQSLLNPARQLAIVDVYGSLGEKVSHIAQVLKNKSQLIAEKASLIVDERTYQQQIDLLRFQVTEIESAKLKPGSEETIESDYRRASNAARLLELSQHALNQLDGEESSVLTQLGTVGRLLQDLQRLDSGAQNLASLHAQASELVAELRDGLSTYSEHVDIDPARLQELEARVDLLQSLRRKYGSTVEEIIAHGAEARAKLQSMEGREETLARINRDLAQLDEQITKAAAQLSALRKKLLPKLAKGVSAQLHDLGFKQSLFEITVTPLAEVGASGADHLEFLFAPNPGEPLQPLRSIASSGEMARVMLAIKTVLAAEDRVPLLVFDEVDANVGGETARAVGLKMREIGTQRQVLCITHLPPVAAAAQHHYVVEKTVREGRTFTSIQLLEGEARVTELARMLGGQSGAARLHAEELLR